jgi:putative chitinase
MEFDHAKYFSAYRYYFSETLRQSQVNGMEFLLSCIGNDLGTEAINNIEQAAYILATIKHETANTFQPIEEYGKGKGKPYGLSDPITKKIYYGRGYVQLTWKKNYKAMSKYLGIDLVLNPELACSPAFAYRILVTGLDNGVFGKDLDDMINARITDFINARRTVNGTDRALHIAKIADKFLSILNGSVIK